jgi:hypothetical protein
VTWLSHASSLLVTMQLTESSVEPTAAASAAATVLKECSYFGGMTGRGQVHVPYRTELLALLRHRLNCIAASGRSELVSATATDSD